MARLSDIIETFIKGMILDNDGIIELQRNEIANKFNCVPSQINYVLDTRFTTEKGYYVESRRGGGGCIIIKRVKIGKADYLMHIINNVGDFITQTESFAFIDNFLDYEIINERELMLMKAATSDKALSFSQPERDIFRAKVLKNMLITLVSNS